jgi:CRP/FNR family cyclic AMP-dependent transcriptional regulator
MGSLGVLDQSSTGVRISHIDARRQWPSNGRTIAKSKDAPAFDTKVILDLPGVMKSCVEYQLKEAIFAQGDPATSVMYIQEGGVMLSVVNETGNEAVVAILGPGDFFGEGCLAGQATRNRTAVAIMPSRIVSIEKSEMIRLMQPGSGVFDRFFSHMLSRNMRVEEDLIDQILNSSEKRLARTLLLLARQCKQEESEMMVPKMSQETLAEMVGTTRSRVNHFMNKFRRLGLIKYDGDGDGFTINRSLMGVVLNG